jgi:hypothetical protein
MKTWVPGGRPDVGMDAFDVDGIRGTATGGC